MAKLVGYPVLKDLEIRRIGAAGVARNRSICASCLRVVVLVHVIGCSRVVCALCVRSLFACGTDPTGSSRRPAH